MRLLKLIVEPAQDILRGLGMVVLNELALQTGGLLEGTGVEAFEEEASLVTEYLGFEDDDIGDG